MGRHFTARLHPMPVVLRSFSIVLLLSALCMAVMPAAAAKRRVHADARPVSRPSTALPVSATTEDTSTIRPDGSLAWLFEAQREIAGIWSTAALSPDER